MQYLVLSCRKETKRQTSFNHSPGALSRWPPCGLTCLKGILTHPSIQNASVCKPRHLLHNPQNNYIITIFHIVDVEHMFLTNVETNPDMYRWCLRHRFRSSAQPA